ncbi:glycosyltransferase family 4 protein [Mycobacterium sp. NPDC003323]
MVALAKVAGKGARHIVLSQMMAKDLRATMPEIRQTLIIGNAALVDQSLLDLPLKADQDRIVLGHLSNLYLDKGIAEVVELAIRLHRAGCELRLIVGGPVAESAAQDHLERAASLLGHRFEYRGRLNGSEKHEFFNEITHFVFPSAYAHESVPLVLYEAMAAGVVCVATRRGSIAEQLSGSPGVLARSRETFVEDVLPVISKMAASSKSSMESRECYTRALAEANLSVEEFISVLRRGH